MANRCEQSCRNVELPSCNGGGYWTPATLVLCENVCTSIHQASNKLNVLHHYVVKVLGGAFGLSDLCDG